MPHLQDIRRQLLDKRRRLRNRQRYLCGLDARLLAAKRISRNANCEAALGWIVRSNETVPGVVNRQRWRVPEHQPDSNDKSKTTLSTLVDQHSAAKRGTDQDIVALVPTISASCARGASNPTSNVAIESS